MTKSFSNSPTSPSKRKQKKRKSREQFVSIGDVRCPICKGYINNKWFNFQTKNVVDFIAECWQPEKSHNYEETYPRHIFRFQIAIPEPVLIKGKWSKAFQ